MASIVARNAKFAVGTAVILVVRGSGVGGAGGWALYADGFADGYEGQSV
jgi:hypothetical protein